MSDTTLKPCPFCGAAAAYTEHEKTNETRGCCPRGCGAEGPFGARSLGPGLGDAMARDGWNTRPIEDALRARAHTAEATAARLNAANVRLMRRLGPALGAWKAAADIVAQLRQEREAAEAAQATARAGAIAVCGCASGYLCVVDEDGLCTDCGCDVVVVADQHSADIVAQLRQEREAAEAALATARAEGAAAERAAVVAWLHSHVSQTASAGYLDLAWAAVAVERGAHVRPVEGA